MDFTYPREVEEFRTEFGRYLDSVVSPDLLEEIWTSGAETTNASRASKAAP